MQQLYHNHDGIDFTVYYLGDGTFQASHVHGLCGFGNTALAACQDAFSVESAYAIYDAVWKLEDLLTGALRGGTASSPTSTSLTTGQSGDVHRDLLTIARDPLTRWLEDYDSQKVTYIQAVHLMSAALDAFAACGYSVDTSEIWTAMP